MCDGKQRTTGARVFAICRNIQTSRSMGCQTLHATEEGLASSLSRGRTERLCSSIPSGLHSTYPGVERGNTAKSTCSGEWKVNTDGNALRQLLLSALRNDAVERNAMLGKSISLFQALAESYVRLFSEKSRRWLCSQHRTLSFALLCPPPSAYDRRRGKVGETYEKLLSRDVRMNTIVYNFLDNTAAAERGRWTHYAESELRVSCFSITQFRIKCKLS